MSGEDTPVKIYLATSGEYSDYQILGVFTRREDAESYALSDRVEEYELHDGPIEVRQWHTMLWWADHPDEGTTDFRMSNPYLTKTPRDFDGHPGHVQHRWEYSWGHTSKFLCVEGWDLRRVKKVYSEQRAQHLAHQEGIA